MTESAFESAKNAILRESKANGGLTRTDLFDLIAAANGASVERDAETQRILRGHTALIDKHEVANANREERFIRAQHETLAIAAEEQRQCQEEHLREFHVREPRRATDLPGEDWRDPSPLPDADKRTLTEALLSYSAAKWAVRGIIAALIVFGVSYGADSCSRHAYWSATPPEVVVTAAPTPTATP